MRFELNLFIVHLDVRRFKLLASIVHELSLQTVKAHIDMFIRNFYQLSVTDLDILSSEPNYCKSGNFHERLILANFTNGSLLVKINLSEILFSLQMI